MRISEFIDHEGSSRNPRIPRDLTLGTYGFSGHKNLNIASYVPFRISRFPGTLAHSDDLKSIFNRYNMVLQLIPRIQPDLTLGNLGFLAKPQNPNMICVDVFLTISSLSHILIHINDMQFIPKAFSFVCFLI